MSRPRLVRWVLASALPLSTVACGGEVAGRSANGLTTDTASSAGDVSQDSAIAGVVFHGVKYPLTSENYRKWLVAQAALDSVPEPSLMPRVELRDPTDDDVERTVKFLGDDGAARRAIERSGLTVKDFVLTSIALGQALGFAGDELVPKENRSFVQSNRAEIVRAREARRFHVLDDDEDDDHGHGRGHGKHGHKHEHKHGN